MNSPDPTPRDPASYQDFREKDARLLAIAESIIISLSSIIHVEDDEEGFYHDDI